MRKAGEIRRLQAGLDRRTRIEQEAEGLICKCRFGEAAALLAALDDGKVLQHLGKSDVTQD